MQAVPPNSGEMSQGSGQPPAHPTVVTIDPAARRARRAYDTVSASAIGLELGVAVLLGMAFGHWLDGKAGTDPWLMILFLCFGFAAGMRGIIRAMNQADREAAGG